MTVPEPDPGTPDAQRTVDVDTTEPKADPAIGSSAQVDTAVKVDSGPDADEYDSYEVYGAYDDEAYYYDDAIWDEPAGDRSSLFLGGLLALFGHVAAIIPAFLVLQASTGAANGFNDLGNAAMTLVVTEIVLALLCVGGGIWMIAKGRRRFGSGMIIGWAFGMLVGFAVLRLG